MGLMAIVIGLSMAGQAGTPDDVVRCGLEATSAEERAALADTMVGDDAASPLVEEIALRLRDCAIRAGYDATSGPQAVGVGLIVGGALGNVWDRLQHGAVADFINMSCCGIQNPFAFNVADAAIFGGAALLILAGRATGRDATRRVR